MEALQIVDFDPSENKAERKRFIQLAWAINSKDPAWVPPLRLTVEDAINTKKNPFYKHARMRLYNAYRGKELVGRIAGIVDDVHNKIHDEKTGFWGFFECINDLEVARALFAKAEAFVRAEGMTAIRGPANPSLNHECGLVINAFDRQPYIMMTHNPAYYVDLVTKLGHEKVKDLYAYDMTPSDFDPRVARIADKVKARGKIEIRPINMKNFAEETKIIRDIYNVAWEKNWGFTPMDDAEFEHMAKSLKDVVWPEFCLLGFQHGKPIGFALSLPDINQVLKGIPSGRLLPFGIFKLLKGLRPKAGVIKRVRVLILGVTPEWRSSGIASVFYHENAKTAAKLGLTEPSEMSWILEDNRDMNSAIEAFAGRPAYKTFRMYEKKI